MRTWHFLCISSLLGVGCSGGDTADTASAPGASDTTDQGAPDGGTATPEPSPACVPKPGPDLPDDTFEDSNCDGIDGDRTAAVFVSPSGSDDSPGTLEAPVRTLARAVTLAAASGKYVLVANGSYPESLVLENSNAPTAIYGGYTDKTWQRVEDRAVVAPPSGIPLILRGLTSTISIDRMSFKAPAELEPSSSSVAVFAANSTAVMFTHTTMEAGRGADGESPPPPTTDTSQGSQLYGAPGLPGDSPSPGYEPCGQYAPIRAECYQPQLGGGAGTWQNGVGWGGPGGTGGYETSTGGEVSPTNGSNGGLAGGGVGGVIYSSGGATNLDSVFGFPGAEGSPGSAGQPGSALGVVTETGYTASNNGTQGSSGTEGAGGGGGAGGLVSHCGLPNGRWLIGVGGGQRGHGGRGGQGTTGSPAGGASIGLLIFQTDVSLLSSTITTALGGRGADAIPGADGQAGGAGGAGGYSFESCEGGTWYRGFDGGPGGRGGTGGAGGAGGGGPSIGILSSSGSPAPKTQSVTINLGAGGKGGFGIGAPNAANGLTKEIHQIGGVTP